MRELLVSIIMPAYNAAEYIAESIESVQAQTYPGWELLVVDDGSTDNTKDIVRNYANKDSRIKYIYQENGRQGKARNNGIRNSNGAYLAFLDADDLWLPKKLEIQLQTFKDYDADLIFCDSFVFTGEFHPGNTVVINTPREEFVGLEGLKKLLSKNHVPILTCISKREAILKAGCFTERSEIQNAEDYHLWLKLLLADYKLLGINETLTAYREVNSSVSGLNTDRASRRQAIEAIYDLQQNASKHKDVLHQYLIIRIEENMGYLPTYGDADFFTTLKRHLNMSKRRYLLPFIQFFQMLKLRSLALKTTYFSFNYL
jgi:teichuronic acid biosynthesis glycosyltransferase TuaG